MCHIISCFSPFAHDILAAEWSSSSLPLSFWLTYSEKPFLFLLAGLGICPQSFRNNALVCVYVSPLDCEHYEGRNFVLNIFMYQAINKCSLNMD